MGMRSTLPSLDGLRPRSDSRTARSSAAMIDGSNGCATIRAGSGTDMVATWLIGIFDPYASTITLCSMSVEARPVRTPASSLRTNSICPSMRFLISACRLLTSDASMAVLVLSGDDGADGFAHDDAADIALRL